MIWTVISVLLLCRVTYGAKPTETTLSLTRDSADPDTLSIGMTTTLTLTATFAESTTGVTVELLPSVLEDVFVIKSVDGAIKGAEINVNGGWDVSSLHTGQENTGNVVYNTRAVFNIGDVSLLAGTSENEEDYQIKIDYTVVMVSMGGYDDDATFWTSSGMEYNYIWISQISYKLEETIASVAEEATVTAQDVSTITVGQSQTVDLTISIPYPKCKLTVEAIVLNDTSDIHVTKIRVKEARDAFAYQLDLSSLVKEIDKECPLKTSLSYEIGTLINAESQKTGADSSKNFMGVEVTLQAKGSADIVGNQYNIGLGVHINATETDSDEIWVTSFYLTAEAGTLNSFTTFSLLEPTSTAISPGFVEQIMIELQIPVETEYSYEVALTTEPVGGAHPSLSLVSIRSVSYGDNLLCELANGNATFTATPADGPKNSGSYTFTLSNYGFNSGGNDMNKLTLAVVLMVKPHANVQTNDEHKFIVNINGVGEQQKIFTVGGPGTIPSTVDYSFEINNECPTNKFESGSSITFDIIVTTEPNIVAGPMTVEVPIPSSVDVSNFQFCSAKVTNIGKNVVCAQEGAVTPTLSSWLSDGVDDHAVIKFDVMCNIMSVNVTQENKFTIQVTVKVRDNTDIPTNGLDGSVAAGAAFSGTQIWVGSYQVQIMPVTQFEQVKAVEAVVVASDDITTTSFKATPPLIQWSPDGIIFYDSPFQFKTPVTETNETRYELEKSILTKYIRLTDKSCKSGCRPSYSFVSTSADQTLITYGTQAKTDKIRARMMFAHDKDNDTCIDLPTKSDSTTPPALWTVMNDLNVTANYTLVLSGKSISCNTPGGLQVTVPMFPKTQFENGNMTGKMKKCSFVSEANDGSLKSCRYSCPCSGYICSSLVLFMLHREESPALPYQLCDLTISE